MKIRSTVRGTDTTVNRRGTGDGLVINQGKARILLTPKEWRELREAGNELLGND